jgi:hypothetical protein
LTFSLALAHYCSVTVYHGEPVSTALGLLCLSFGGSAGIPSIKSLLLSGCQRITQARFRIEFAFECSPYHFRYTRRGMAGHRPYLLCSPDRAL